MNEVLKVRLDARWGTVCIGVDNYGDTDLEEDLISEYYMVTEGTLILDTQDRDEEHIVELTIRMLDKYTFSNFAIPKGLREITDPQNDILLISGAARLGCYEMLEYGLEEEDLAFDVRGYSQARFRAFSSEDLHKFEVILLLK